MQRPFGAFLQVEGEMSEESMCETENDSVITPECLSQGNDGQSISSEQTVESSSQSLNVATDVGDLPVKQKLGLSSSSEMAVGKSSICKSPVKYLIIPKGRQGEPLKIAVPSNAVPVTQPSGQVKCYVVNEATCRQYGRRISLTHKYLCPIFQLLRPIIRSALRDDLIKGGG